MLLGIICLYINITKKLNIPSIIYNSMGWLKNLFGTKELEKHSITLAEINLWLDSRTKQSILSLNEELKSAFSEIRETLNSLKHEVYCLENAQIKDPDKIQNRVKSVVLGHKTNYIRMLNHFINSIEIPDKQDYKSAIDFCYSANSSLDRLGVETIKTFYTVQHLFHSEVEEIAKTLKQFDRNLKEIKIRIEQRNLHLLADAKIKIQELRDEIRKKEELSKNIEECKISLAGYREQFADFTSRLNDLKKSKSYNDFQELSQEKEDIDAKFALLESEIIQIFAPLEHSLKKLQKISLENEDIIAEYIENPLASLIFDKELKLLGIMEKLKSGLGTIEPNEKKREKLAEQAARISKELLGRLLNEHSSLNERKNEIEKQLSANPSLSSIKELEYKIAHVDDSAKKLKLKIEEAEKQFFTTETDKIKKELEDLLRKITNADVAVII
jgi:flagellar motor protein MotB